MEAALESILINTYNPDPSLRKQAEQALEQFVRTPGSLAAIINCVGHVAMHRELRQATGIVLKNRLRDYYAKGEGDLPSPNALPSSAEEREYLKGKIVDVLLVEQDNSIRGILAESIRIVAEFEFPHNWANLVPTLISQLQQHDVLRIYNALLALRKLVKRYEYKASEQRKPLNDTLQYAFPHLQALMTAIIHNQTIEAAQVMRVCLKIFWSSTNYMLPKVSGVDVNLWFSLIAEIMNKRLPEASEGVEPLGQPLSPEERKTWPWWKLKKWAARIMTHFLQRYGNPRYCSDEDKPFAEYFRENTAVQLLGPAMNNLQMKAQGAYLTEDVHRSCLTYLSNCAEMSPTYKLIKPHIQFLLFEVVFPTLCMTQEDARLFDEDPVEFIRKVHDPVSDWLSPMVAATNLLQMLARYRQKDVMPVFLPFLQDILSQYNSAPPEARDYRKKDGALVAMASLSKIMKDNDDYERLLLPILVHHVLPEFKSPVAFLRARACWAIEYFAEIDWTAEATHTDITLYLQQLAASGGSSKKEKKDKKKENKTRRGVNLKGKKAATDAALPTMTAGEALQSVLQGLLQSLRDPALPVQTAAACSLRLLISQEGATDLLRPLLPDIVREYFRIMEEAENESILAALQAIVLQYGDEIAGIAPMMTQHLVASFNKYAADSSGDDEEAAFNAVQCLDTIDAILEAVGEREDVVLSLQPLLLPLFLRVLTTEGDCFEYLDTVINMIAGFTYYGETITDALWTVCGPVLFALNEWAIDYVAEIMVPLINYMTKGVATFLQASHNGRPFVQILFEVVQKTYENAEEGYSGREINSASTLLTCLLTSCKDKVPAEHAAQLISPTLSLVLKTLPRVKLTSVTVRLLEVLLSALYLDTQSTLRVLREEHGESVTATVFALLFEKLPTMERDLSQRLVVLAFSSLLCSPRETLPEMVRLNLPSMFQQVIRELVHIEEEARKDPEADEDDEDDESMIEDDIDLDDDEHSPFDESDARKAALNRAKALYVPEGGYGEDEDCVNAEDEAYREALEAMDKEERVKRELGDDAIDDEEDEDYTYTSPIESFNMSQVFLTAMQALQARDAVFADSLRTSLAAEDQARLQQIVHFAANPAPVAEE